ncbi:MAG TPA: hypothetical protein VN455_00385 [Methanotrichaceae archaeon]|nr:hypothetical protein [Methanotrichaceae archaeon]
MLNILELDDRTIYAENDRWQCNLGAGKPVRLGVIFEAVTISEARNMQSNGSFSVIIESHLIPQPECLDEEVALEADEDGGREGLIIGVYRLFGGVPVNIDAVQPAKASCGFSSFVADSKIASLNDSEMEVRCFKDVKEALKFARDFYAIYATGLFGFIDEVLDNPLRSGGTGRDLLRQLVKGL